jgi:hypothetical protein
MKQNKVLSIVAVIAAAVVLSTTSVTTAFAASRTNTAEVLGATRARGDAGTPAVLGASRSNASVDVQYAKVTDQKALKTIGSKAAIAKIINEAIKNVVSTEKATAGSSAQVSESVGTVSKSDIEVVASMDLQVPDGTAVSKEKPLYVTFTVPGVTAKSHVYVLHYNHNGVWEVVPSKAEQGNVVAAFTQLSPVAIVVEKDTLQTASKGSKSAVSPRTGESEVPYMAATVCAVAAIAIMILNQKKKKHI